jgi:glutamate 5-kinase
MRIVIKFGTSTLTGGTPYLARPQLVNFARQTSHLLNEGHQVVLVSSGAIAAGKERLGFPLLPKDMPAKQMLAAVGQPYLMSVYDRIFGFYDITIAQILLTRMDLSRRRPYLNARNTLMALIEQKIVPIVNENDTVAIEEIRVGDNDNLSALAANLVDADILILLTDQAGLYTANPSIDKTAQLVEKVVSPEIPSALWQAAGGPQTGLGTGGMTTKLQAADLVRRSGTACVIAAGNAPDVLLRLANGEKLGTYFAPITSSLESRKRYILSARHAPGILSIDEGAAQALQRGGSLLSIGTAAASGAFERGDTVRVARLDGSEIARGIVNYCSRDLAQIVRRPSSEINSILGYHLGDEVIHRNDMVLLNKT